MKKVEQFFKLLTDKKYRFSVMTGIGFYDHYSDRRYLEKRYKIIIGRKLNLSNPQTYTEKLQWLKLYDRKEKYTILQDKLLVRDYVKETIGEEYLIPLLGAWDKGEDIDFDSLPEQFVLKCNHDCASVIICRDKSKLNQVNTIKKLNTCLKNDYWKYGREWAYKDIPRKIIAEEYKQDGNNKTLTDYKLFCFDGKAKMVLAASGEAHTDERRTDYYDLDFNPLPIIRGNIANSNIKHQKPIGFEKVVQLAEKLSQGIPFIRVDFYIIDGHPYFGEIAFYPSSGFAEFKPEEWEQRIGEWIKLPQVTK